MEAQEHILSTLLARSLPAPPIPVQPYDAHIGQLIRQAETGIDGPNLDAVHRITLCYLLNDEPAAAERLLKREQRDDNDISLWLAIMAARAQARHSVIENLARNLSWSPISPLSSIFSSLYKNNRKNVVSFAKDIVKPKNSTKEKEGVAQIRDEAIVLASVIWGRLPDIPNDLHLQTKEDEEPEAVSSEESEEEGDFSLCSDHSEDDWE